MQRVGDVLRDLTLDCEDVVHLAIPRLRPDVLVRTCVDQLRHDAQARPRPPHAALENVRDTRVEVDLTYALLPVLVLHGRRTRHHAQTADAGELRDDV